METLDPREVIRKTTAGTTTQYDELIITEVLREVERQVRENSVIRNFYRTINMPSPTYNLPYQDVRMVVGHVAEGGDISALYDVPEVKEKTQLVAQKLVAYSTLTSESIDDTVFDLVGFVVSEAVTEIGLAEENAFINGDQTTYDPSSSTDERAICDGILKLCESNTNNVDLTQTPITLNAMNTAMANVETDHYDIADYAWFMHPKDIATLRGMDEFEHADKFGGRGSIQSGFQGVVYGIPIISARTIPTNLGTDTNETVAILANKRYGWIGQYTGLRAYRFYQQTHDRLELQWNERLNFVISTLNLESHAMVTGIVA